ncbi:MAG TPA: 3-isopropylmalate dehydratase small subunit [Polyangiaceae bacterium LLY-WYZ-15_(1-7)]|nr:3-isopropylmalate dehydratase small subunit [Myxococcales bacterium]MAT28255.1 3-isopropylmalate dehydratase small subunit [Sandaracinus sp.]HJK89751.1 3-isopropylmalate dehydratase small subunit [Polyangiaceae bacterium LLY-WYZ-15_(1-7)]MBJ75301.1 3-isopropylmalate dehydratase small subunit [Sandaracinus sp.]HJL01055.1 3-isopropylmalate dehydratase small subunit [Polyangiaceae bacterium LLY-WYZ-15_(1-7)]
MEPFEKLESRVVPLVADNVDTDQIIPARFLKVTDKEGLGERLFADWRYEADGSPKPDFVLNQPRHQGAQVLLAGANFGSGSSREHAPWALVDWGFKAIVARSFADIFQGNALKNGLLPIPVDAEAHAALAAALEADPAATVSIDVAAQTLTLPGGEVVEFPLDPFSKHCLLQGVDELGYLLGFEDAIAAHEARRA